MKFALAVVWIRMVLIKSQQNFTTCDDCGYLSGCFTTTGCADFNPFINAWTNSYESCNPGKHCAPCYPNCDLMVDNSRPYADGCGPAAICFESAGCANYNTITNEWTGVYANCNDDKYCAPRFPDCVIPGTDYSPPYQKLSCTSESEFLSDAIVDEDSRLTCTDAGLTLNLDCLDPEQRTMYRNVQFICCGGAEYIETLCPDYPVLSNGDVCDVCLTNPNEFGVTEECFQAVSETIPESVLQANLSACNNIESGADVSISCKVFMSNYLGCIIDDAKSSSSDTSSPSIDDAKSSIGDVTSSRMMAPSILVVAAIGVLVY